MYNLKDTELQDLFVLGFNHDIGYEYGNNSTHEYIGGEILKRNNYKYWKEIYYHGDTNTKYTSLFLTILNKADMQIDRNGNDVGYDKRLEDIKSRYGENSTTYFSIFYFTWSIIILSKIKFEYIKTPQVNYMGS